VNLRTARVLVLLLVLGAIVGALCGALAVIPLAIRQAYWPIRDDALIGSATSWLPITMGVGATVGGIVGPSVSLALLRSIPLWRILLIPTSAAIVGMFASWALFRFRVLPQTLTNFSPLWLPVAAAVAAAIWLRRSSRSGVRDTVRQ